KESGNFKGTKISMSKRGSRFARRVLFTAARCSISSVNEKAVNPVLKQYYELKKQSKPKKVALGAVMHKITNFIFAVLRDNQPFVIKSVDEHCTDYQNKQIA
ncbi:transposase, partial [Alkalibaculum sp. M08DMB]